MNFLKCIFAGSAAVFIAFILLPMAFGIWGMIHFRQSEMSLGWDPVSFAMHPAGLISGAVIFCCAAVWQFLRGRRAKRSELGELE